MFRSAVTLAFFGTLRCSEYTCRSSTSFDHTAELTFEDIRISQDRRIASINIKAPKTDPFKLGVVVRVSCIVNQFCPVQALISCYMGCIDGHEVLYLYSPMEIT